MPSVASEAQAPALKPASPLPLPLPRPQPADDNASPSPFESMLDDTAQAAAPLPPPPPPPSQSTVNSNNQTSASSQPGQPQAPSTNPTSAKRSGDAAKPAADAKANTTAKPVTPLLTGKTFGDTKATDDKVDGDKSDGDKVKTTSKTDTTATAADALTTPDPTKPANLAPVVTALPAPAPTPTEAPGADAPVADAVALAAVIAPATKQATPAAPKTDASTPAIAKDKSAGLVRSQPNLDQSVDNAKAAAAKDATAADGKPQPLTADSDKPAPTHTTHDDVAIQLLNGAQPAPTADAQAAAAVAAKPVDATQTLVVNMPAQNVAAADAASAPAPQLAQPPAALAVPLAGVGLEIAGKALAGKNHFEIRLDPPELGRIEVRLDVTRDGSISSHVIADRKDTLDLLQRDASGLQRAFEDAGLKTSDQGMQFSLRDQSSGQQQNAPSANPAQPIVEDETPIEVLPINYSRLAGSGSGVDIRV